MSAEGSTDTPNKPTLVKAFTSTSIIREYRIVMPLTVEEYHIGQLYGVAEASKNETGGGDGVTVVFNEPRQFILSSDPKKEVRDAQYTDKIFHLETKVPALVKTISPAGSLTMTEKAFNAYPYCKTTYENDYMKDNFHIDIETMHAEGDGNIENIHNLTPNELGKREVVRIDIANDKCDSRDYKKDEDPKLFTSEKTGRGPLVGVGWEKKTQPVMCCYKLYRVKFKWLFLQNAVESMIMKNVKRLLFNFHRQVFCWIDRWHGMTIQDIRALEAKTKQELEELIKSDQVRGTIE